MLISFAMPLKKANAQADSPHNFMPLGYETPGASTCFDAGEMKDLANYKMGCDVCKANLRDTEATLQKCISAGAPATKWWADPKFVVGGFALSFSVGLVVGLISK